MTRVFLICSGLGHIQRGYESFTKECFEALATDPALDITLFQGRETSISNAIALWNLPRNHAFTKQVAGLFSKYLTFGDPYFLEQASFCFSLIPYLHLKKPDVILFSDFALGTMLWHWRRMTKLPYRLLFSNGAPNGPPFSRMDHVQHLTPIHYQAALDAGEPVSKHSLIPYGIQINQEYSPLASDERDALRQKLELLIDRPLILSVAAINNTHKRMDYLIREVASLPEPRPYLLLLGQMEQESLEVLQLGNQLLGAEHFQAKTVSSAEVADYYKVADLYVLASLSEGFGRVLLEAMGHGLPCLVHDYGVSRHVLKDHGFFADFTTAGALTKLIQSVLDQVDNEAKNVRHQVVYDRFSWDKLAPAYAQMIHQCAAETN
ncbi:glycosyltransferase family 4 protein [Lyngbya confervoides]|uniref:Glycosyltransferase family 4 protein n=1 Tax=Lyngbya confervoides BDU141951 TaxID=1574623 RepID=A0ABD4SXJ3_9CYAN|nr:glycosyltransferase family 4 protein [Lyngbya confervoides]MCM1981245.1 glycosyltransferase family 4 protein [Lyngbya confervoides BDU141951]